MARIFSPSQQLLMIDASTFEQVQQLYPRLKWLLPADEDGMLTDPHFRRKLGAGKLRHHAYTMFFSMYTVDNWYTTNVALQSFPTTGMRRFR